MKGLRILGECFQLGTLTTLKIRPPHSCNCCLCDLISEEPPLLSCFEQRLSSIHKRILLEIKSASKISTKGETIRIQIMYRNI